MPVDPQHGRPKRVEERLYSEMTLLEFYHFIVSLFTRGANEDFPEPGFWMIPQTFKPPAHLICRLIETETEQLLQSSGKGTKLWTGRAGFEIADEQAPLPSAEAFSRGAVLREQGNKERVRHLLIPMTKQHKSNRTCAVLSLKESFSAWTSAKMLFQTHFSCVTQARNL